MSVYRERRLSSHHVRPPDCGTNTTELLVTFSRSLSACLAVALVWVSVGANASAGIVFGNLGPTGATELSSTNTDLGTQSNVAVNWIAQGFNTGSSSQLYLNSVELGMYGIGTGSIPLTVSIFSSVSNAPGSLLFTSATTNVGTVGKYSFSFSGVQLTGSQSISCFSSFANKCHENYLLEYDREK